MCILKVVVFLFSIVIISCKVKSIQAYEYWKPQTSFNNHYTTYQKTTAQRGSWSDRRYYNSIYQYPRHYHTHRYFDNAGYRNQITAPLEKITSLVSRAFRRLFPGPRKISVRQGGGAGLARFLNTKAWIIPVTLLAFVGLFRQDIANVFVNALEKKPQDFTNLIANQNELITELKNQVNTNNADVANLLDRVAVAEENISDLTLSTQTACETLDLVGAPNFDCCISGNSDQGPFICVSRQTAIDVGIDIDGPCAECPA